MKIITLTAKKGCVFATLDKSAVLSNEITLDDSKQSLYVEITEAEAEEIKNNQEAERKKRFPKNIKN